MLESLHDRGKPNWIRQRSIANSKSRSIVMSLKVATIFIVRSEVGTFVHANSARVYRQARGELRQTSRGITKCLGISGEMMTEKTQEDQVRGAAARSGLKLIIVGHRYSLASTDEKTYCLRPLWDARQVVSTLSDGRFGLVRTTGKGQRRQMVAIGYRLMRSS